MQQVRITIPFFLWFLKFRKPLKRIVTLTSRKTIENSPHNKKLLDQQNQEESSENSREALYETKFKQILFFFCTRRSGGNIKDRKHTK